MGDNARKAVEHALAELDRVVSRTSGGEVLDDIAAEVRSKHEGFRSSPADHDVVAGGAGQRIAAARADDRLAGTRPDDVARRVDLLRCEGTSVAQQIGGVEAPLTVGPRCD